VEIFPPERKQYRREGDYPGNTRCTTPVESGRSHRTTVRTRASVEGSSRRGYALTSGSAGTPASPFRAKARYVAMPLRPGLRCSRAAPRHW
jgi:hypothetical protein